MAKPNIPNQKKKYQELNSRLNRYVALVEQIYDTLNLEAAKIALNTEYDADSGTVFKFLTIRKPRSLLRTFKLSS